MENRINEVVELENGREYFILKQAVYQGHNYYVSTEVDKSNETLTENFVVFKEIKEGTDVFLEIETDVKKLQIILKHLNLN